MGRDIPECRARIGGVDPAEARLAFRTAAPMVTLAPCMIWLSLSVVRDTCFLATRWLGAASPPPYRNARRASSPCFVAERSSLREFARDLQLILDRLKLRGR